MKKIALILGLLLSVTLVTPASPAHAAVSDCQSSETCTFEATSWSGAHYDYNNLLHGCISIGPLWDNRISSVANHIPRKVWFYEDAGCTGRVIMIAANTNWTAQKQNPNWPNNSFTSFYIFSSA